MAGSGRIVARRGARSRLFGCTALVAAVAAAGAASQAFAAARDRRRHPPPGRLVDVGGHRLHLNITGERRKGPTVVLDAGGTSFSPQWARVQPGIARFARVVS